MIFIKTLDNSQEQKNPLTSLFFLNWLSDQIFLQEFNIILIIIPALKTHHAMFHSPHHTFGASFPYDFQQKYFFPFSFSSFHINANFSSGLLFHQMPKMS